MTNKNKSGLQNAREKAKMNPLELAALLKVNESVLKRLGSRWRNYSFRYSNKTDEYFRYIF